MALDGRFDNSVVFSLNILELRNKFGIVREAIGFVPHILTYILVKISQLSNGIVPLCVQKID